MEVAYNLADVLRAKSAITCNLMNTVGTGERSKYDESDVVISDSGGPQWLCSDAGSEAWYGAAAAWHSMAVTVGRGRCSVAISPSAVIRIGSRHTTHPFELQAWYQLPTEESPNAAHEKCTAMFVQVSSACSASSLRCTKIKE